jgi:hypothetical protein
LDGCFIEIAIVAHYPTHNGFDERPLGFVEVEDTCLADACSFCDSIDSELSSTVSSHHVLGRIQNLVFADDPLATHFRSGYSKPMDEYKLCLRLGRSK